MTVKKVLAGDFLDLGGCGKPDDRLRAFFRAPHEWSIEPGHKSRETFETGEEISVDPTRVHAVDRDSSALQSSGELVCENDIGQFRLAVGFTTAVTMLELWIVKIDMPQFMPVGG